MTDTLREFFTRPRAVGSCIARPGISGFGYNRPHFGRLVIMFTGIIDEVRKLTAIQRAGNSARIVVNAPGIAAGVSIGDSVAINGVCLTAVAVESSNLSFDAVPETIERTGLKSLKPSDCVNLE